MKIVKNVCYGGFGLSDLALSRLSEITGKSKPECIEDYEYEDSNRSAPELVQVVEELGKKANDCFSDLVVVEIPDGVDWVIDDYDGIETIHEVHRSW